MTTDITELAQEARINAGCGEYLSPAETMELVEALEKTQHRITELESRTVKLPESFKLAKSSSGLMYYFADEVDAAIIAAGIKVEDE